jgi:gamma-glutamylcyclotransferase (GGCT)/AIG2-like uncharacterized protein YtfP
VAELRTHFHLFVYGTLRSDGPAAHMLRDAKLIGGGEVGGVLYNIDDAHPALVLYGSTQVQGEVWLCPNEILSVLDEYEQVSDGLTRRVGTTVRTDVGQIACWTYVAGPALSRKLVPAQRVEKWQQVR